MVSLASHFEENRLVWRDSNTFDFIESVWMSAVEKV